MSNEIFWQDLVTKWRQSGQTAAKFMKGRGYAPATLKWWASRLKHSTPSSSVAPSVSLVQVVTRPAGPTGSREGCSGVSLEVPGGRVVLAVGFDESTLSRVLDVIACRAGAHR